MKASPDYSKVFFYMYFTIRLTSSEQNFQDHHNAEADSEEDGAQIGM